MTSREGMAFLSRIAEAWVGDLGKLARRTNAKANGRAATIRRLAKENARLRRDYELFEEREP